MTLPDTVFLLETCDDIFCGFWDFEMQKSSKVNITLKYSKIPKAQLN